MSIATDRESATVGTPPGSADHVAPADHSRRPVVALVVLLAAAWGLAWLADLLHADWAMLPVMVVAIASILRAGRFLLDRLMLSLFLLLGLLMVGGLLFSVWPWGLEPLPVTGSVLTAVVVTGWAARRRPALPRQVTLSDLIILGTGGFAYAIAVHPLSRLSAVASLRYSTTSEDRSAHFSIFDAIHNLGGYLFLHQHGAQRWVLSPTEAVYPQGSHYLYALVDIFARSTTAAGPATPAFDRYFLLVLGGYALFAMTVVWISRWVLGSFLRSWRLVSATALVSAILLGGKLASLVVAGFDSEVLGLCFVIFTIGVIIRPPHQRAERLLLLGVGIILVSFTYYLYLPVVALAVLAWVIVNRRRPGYRWLPLALGLAPFVVVAAIPLAVAIFAQFDVQAQAQAGGGIIGLPHASVLAASAAVALLMLTPAGRRTARGRVAGLTAGLSALLTGLFGAYQIVQLGHTSYYFEKLVTCYFLICLVCSALLVTALAPVPRSFPSRWPRLNEAAVSLLAAVLVFTSVGGLQIGAHPSSVLRGTWRTSSLGAWFSEKNVSPISTDLARLQRDGLLGDGQVSLVLLTNSGYLNWRMTFVNSTLSRTAGATIPVMNKLLTIKAGGTTVDAADESAAADALVEAVSASPVPVRIVVGDPALAVAISAALVQRPEVHATVLVAP